MCENIVFYSFKNVEFCIRKRHFTGKFINLYLFEENGCWKLSILVWSLWWTCLTQKTCEQWFKRFKSGDFDVKDNERPGQPKKFKDADLQALLDEDSTQTLKPITGDRYRQQLIKLKPFRIATYFDRCCTDFQNNTSILTKNWKFGLMNGWPQKMKSSFGAESILWQRDRKNS